MKTLNLKDPRVAVSDWRKARAAKPAKSRIHNPLLKSMIQCGECEKTVTWQKQRKKYYGSCQRRLEACKKSKYIREEEINTDVASRLEDLVSPVPRVLNWAVEAIQNEHSGNIDITEQQAKAAKKQIQRIKTMDEMLYDDKLAGDISQIKYKEKHIKFEKQLKALSKELTDMTQNYNERHSEFIRIVELSQNASQEFKALEDTDAKRAILIELFESMTLKDGAVSVKYTKLVNAIARKSAETRHILKTMKKSDRATKNTSCNGGASGQEMAFQLVWQG